MVRNVMEETFPNVAPVISVEMPPGLRWLKVSNVSARNCNLTFSLNEMFFASVMFVLHKPGL